MVMLPACSLYSLLPLSSPGLRRPEQSAFISCCLRSWERCWNWEQWFPFLSLETRRTFHHGPRTLHGRTQKLRNHSFKLTVRNLDASSDITKGSIFCAFYCFLCIVGFELAVIFKQCNSSIYSLCLLMTASYEVSVGTSKGRTRTQKDLHKLQELHEKAYMCELDLQ